MFLMQTSQHSDVVIIYDYTNSGVKELVESFSERWAATTLLTATPAPDLSQLLVALTSFHTNDLRYMVLLCSANTTRTIFDMVRDQNLESRRVRWLVVEEEPDLTDPLLYTLREGSLVGKAVRIKSGLYEIYSTYVNHENQVRFQEVGVWRERNENRGRGSLRRPLFPGIVDMYRNFHGRQLVVSSVNNWPFFELRTLENGTVAAQSGIDVSVVSTLAYYLNFTYRVEVPADKQWGVAREDGTVTGMVGEVASRRAHLAINELTITASRETVVDFSYPYFFDSTSLTSKAPGEKSRSLAVFYPFSSLLWIIVVLVTLLMGPLGYLFSRVHHQLTQTFDSTHNERSRNVGPSFDSGRIKWGSEPGLRGVEMFCFNMFRTIIIQGNLLPASSWPLRLVFFSWYAFCLILYAVYAGTLTAYLTKPSFNKPIDSLEDLLEARERGVVASINAGSSFYMVLKTATSGIFKTIHDSLDPSRSFATYGTIAVGEVVEKNTAYMSGRVGSEIYAIQNGREKYHLARDTFMPQPYGIVCPSGAPFTPTFSLMLGRMVESGLVDKWHRDEVTNFIIQQTASQGKGEDQGPGTNMGLVRVAIQPLSLDHLQGGFYILGLGSLMAGSVLIAETLAYPLI
ncbi:hypothetical protein Pmani_015416 [Petrolisthes manimaculis]|uniref:Ionotropic glutamate receptor C-terminal domain-containing protein n=1 Tax=Petrolisthes manimaculis TaxID=1843537 RepID=A0AAE1PS12_9EUCA|nr:hypothetical protein Pmani_015416 [Petrolisthes manimaculis]